MNSKHNVSTPTRFLVVVLALLAISVRAETNNRLASTGEAPTVAEIRVYPEPDQDIELTAKRSGSSEVAGWVSAVAETIMALGLLLAWSQLRASYKQMAANHEMKRRENAVEIMRNWSSGHTPQASAARKLVEGLTRDQVEAMWKQIPFEVPSAKKDLVLGSLIRADNLEATNTGIRLSEDESSELRWQIISFLNGLECVMTGWLYHVVDREMIEDEFKPLVSQQEGHYILKTFREISGIDKYPALEAFSAHLEEKSKSVPTGKPITA